MEKLRSQGSVTPQVSPAGRRALEAVSTTTSYDTYISPVMIPNPKECDIVIGVVCKNSQDVFYPFALTHRIPTALLFFLFFRCAGLLATSGPLHMLFCVVCSSCLLFTSLINRHQVSAHTSPPLKGHPWSSHLKYVCAPVHCLSPPIQCHLLEGWGFVFLTVPSRKLN